MAAGAVFLLTAFLLNSLQAQGSEVFVLRGNDLRLDVKTSVELTEGSDFLWKFGEIKIVKLTPDNKTTIFPTYKESVYFLEGNYSLLVKNPQHNNSGIYKAVVSGETDKTVAEYKVTIKDEVSSVNVTVTTISSSSSSCNLTVTCTTEDSSISRTVHCENQTCSLVKETSLASTIQSSSLNFYLEQDYIICNHSNQVNWKHDNKELKSYCETGSGSSADVLSTIVIGTVVSTVCLAVVFAFIYRKCKKKSKGNTGNVSEEMETRQNVHQNSAEDGSGLHPTSIYALVQFHTGP